VAQLLQQTNPLHTNTPFIHAPVPPASTNTIIQTLMSSLSSQRARTPQGGVCSPDSCTCCVGLPLLPRASRYQAHGNTPTHAPFTRRPTSTRLALRRQRCRRDVDASRSTCQAQKWRCMVSKKCPHCQPVCDVAEPSTDEKLPGTCIIRPLRAHSTPHAHVPYTHTISC